VELEQVHPAGIFEGVVEGAEVPLEYELEVDYPDGNNFTMRDPYSFTPTFGELDMHLAAEGRHEQLYERLGAHVIEHEGADGTAFAVWARTRALCPSSATSTAGTDACTRCARSGRPASGNCSCRTLATAATYKYEILAADGEIRLKAEPYAFATEHPPKTASVVFSSQHKWKDKKWIAQRWETLHRSTSRCRSTRCIWARGG